MAIDTSSKGRPTVFIVDEEHAHQAEMSALLERVGFHARLFDSAEELLSALEVQSPACIITELKLPGMSGLDLTRSLRERNDFTPIIIVTREGDVASAVAAFRSSVADFVIRPFVERDLVNRLHAVLAAGRKPSVSTGSRGIH